MNVKQQERYFEVNSSYASAVLAQGWESAVREPRGGYPCSLGLRGQGFLM
jgi:hypothetical protein